MPERSPCAEENSCTSNVCSDGKASLIRCTSVESISGTRVTRNMNRPGFSAASSKMRVMLRSALSAVTAPPTACGYFSKGAFTSTEKCMRGTRARSSATTSGRMPLVSILTGGPYSAMSAANSVSPGVRVGSPPLMTMPSSQPLRAAKNFFTSAGRMGGKLSGAQASPALWQWGHFKLQPPKKTTAATLPGQSHRERGSRPRMTFQADFIIVAPGFLAYLRSKAPFGTQFTCKGGGAT